MPRHTRRLTDAEADLLAHAIDLTDQPTLIEEAFGEPPGSTRSDSLAKTIRRALNERAAIQKQDADDLVRAAERVLVCIATERHRLFRYHALRAAEISAEIEALPAPTAPLTEAPDPADPFSRYGAEREAPLFDPLLFDRRNAGRRRP